MKTVCIDYKKKFIEEYTLELEDYITAHEFRAIVGLFNHVAQSNPLPVSRPCYTIAMVILWVTMSIAVYFIWVNVHSLYILFLLPVLMIMSLYSLVSFNKARILKFEDKILGACMRLNATENIRGVHFRLTKNGVDINTPIKTFYPIVSHYAIMIDIDDRFNALKSREFQDLVRLPDTVYCPLELFDTLRYNEKYGYFG